LLKEEQIYVYITCATWKTGLSSCGSRAGKVEAGRLCFILATVFLLLRVVAAALSFLIEAPQ